MSDWPKTVAVKLPGSWSIAARLVADFGLDPSTRLNLADQLSKCEVLFRVHENGDIEPVSFDKDDS